MPKASSKELILNAAEDVVLEQGAAYMSMETVAKKAGISKGGLIYHFPTKDDLLKEMVARLLAQFYSERERKLSSLKETKGRLLKAEIQAMLDPNEKRDRMALSILAAAAEAPYLLDPVRKAHQEHLKMLIDSGLPFEKAALVSLAADGLMFLELLHLSPYTEKQRAKLKNALIRAVETIESDD